MPYEIDMETGALIRPLGYARSDKRKEHEAFEEKARYSEPSPSDFCSCPDHSGFYWRDRMTCCADCFKVVPGPNA